MLAAILMAGLIVYQFIGLGQSFRVSGAVSVWYDTAMVDMVPVPYFNLLTMLTAVCIGLLQFVPEMTDKRLKLSLHLPMEEGRIVATMLTFGVMTLCAIYIAAYAVLLGGLRLYFPSEIVASTAWTIVPGTLGAVCAYLMTSWVCLEPVWKYRVFYALASVCLISFFLIDETAGAYAPMMPYLMAFAFICFLFPFFSVARFKEGAQR